MTDTHADASDETTADDNSETVVYGCPLCDDTFGHEMVARVHVTRSTDEIHANQNGLMPEIAINKVDADTGDIVETIQHNTQVMAEDVDAADLSDNLSDRDKHIILAAVYNPYIETYTDLADQANSLLEFNGHDSVSYSTIRTTLQDYLEEQPETTAHSSGDSETISDDETTSTNETMPDEVTIENDGRSLAEVQAELADLEPLQREIIEAFADDPTKNKTDVADEVDCSPSYPGKVLDNYEYLVEDLRNAQTRAHDEIDDVETAPDAADRPTASIGADTELDRLSERHQRAIKTIAARPGASDEAIASHLDASETAIKQLRRNFDDLIDTLADQIEDAPDFEAPAPEAETEESEVEAESTTTTDDGATTGTTARPMSAGPDDEPLDFQEIADREAAREETSADTTSTDTTEADAVAGQDDVPPSVTIDMAGDEADALAAGLEDLQQTIRMFKSSAESELEHAQSREAARLIGVMEQLESQVENLFEIDHNDDEDSPVVHIEDDHAVAGVNAD